MPVLLALGVSLPGACAATSPALGAKSRPRSGHAPLHTKTPPAEVTLTPNLSTAGVLVTMAPVGLSLEYPTMAADLGSGVCPPAALVSQLQALGSPPLSLAGDSQDLTAPSGASPGPAASWETATLYGLPAGFWSQLHCLLNATHDPLTVGLNAKTGSLAWATQMVAGAQSAATNGLSFSLGNEPDLYYLPNYASLSRPVPGEEAAAVNTYLQVATQLQPALAGAPVIGPELARPAHWRTQLPRVIATLHAQTVGVHLYPLTACATPKAVTTKGLLSTQAADLPRSLQWVVADAAAAHIPAIISEANSASCGGVAGVSDSPASAVWAVRFVLAALQTGFQEVRFHSSGAPYDPFVVRGESVLARPIDSALVALNQWLPVGATLRTIAGVRGLVASSVSDPVVAPTGSAGPTTSTGPPAPAAKTMLILDNERTRAQQVMLRGARSVSIETLTATRAGVQTAQLSSPRDRIKLTVAPNSVLAVSPVP
jgi:hypothetical protein